MKRSKDQMKKTSTGLQISSARNVSSMHHPLSPPEGVPHIRFLESPVCLLVWVFRTISHFVLLAWWVFGYVSKREPPHITVGCVCIHCGTYLREHIPLLNHARTAVSEKATDSKYGERVGILRCIVVSSISRSRQGKFGADGNRCEPFGMASAAWRLGHLRSWHESAGYTYSRGAAAAARGWCSV